MKIYTKTGDTGTTALIGGERCPKDDLRVEAYGTVDELSAYLALMRDNMPADNTSMAQYRDDIFQIMSVLMGIEAVLALGKGAANKIAGITDDDISQLEERIDYMGRGLAAPEGFVIPGGHPLVSLSHVCRTVCRRAERCAVKASCKYKIDPLAVVYLNRLSDYLFQLGRKLASELAVAETIWEPEK